MLKYNNKVLKVNSRWLGNNYGTLNHLTLQGNGDFWGYNYMAFESYILGMPREVSVFVKFHAPNPPLDRVVYAGSIEVRPRLFLKDKYTSDLQNVDDYIIYETSEHKAKNTEDMISDAESNIVKFTLNWDIISGAVSPQGIYNMPLMLGYTISNAEQSGQHIYSDVYTSIYY
jgi:hypothetical protein